MIKYKNIKLISILIILIFLVIGTVIISGCGKPKETKTEEINISEVEKEAESKLKEEPIVVSDKKEEPGEKVALEESETSKEKQEEYTELEIGQAFNYKGIKITLTDYYMAECSILGGQGKKELFIYLYVENTGNEPCANIYGYELELYHKGKKSDAYFGLGVLGVCDEIELYNVLGHEKLNPGEVSGGWIAAQISIEWEEKDLEVYFNDFDKIPSILCVWKLE